MPWLLSWTLFALGYIEQALATSHQSIVEACSALHPMTLGFALNRSAALLHLCQDFDRLTLRAQEMMTLAADKGLRPYHAAGRFFLARAQVTSERAGEGLALLENSLADLRAGGDEDWFPYSLSLLADALHEAGETQRGLELLEEALDRVEKNGERWFAAEVHRLRGEVFLALTQPDMAEDCFLRATKVAQEQQAKLWELRAATSLARFWAARGRRADAYELLAPLYRWFTEGFDTVDLKDAKGVLRELEDASAERQPRGAQT